MQLPSCVASEFPKWRQLLAKKLSKSLEFNQGLEEMKLVTREFINKFTFI